MKLYTKKMTYSLLATGLLACAPVKALFPRIKCKKMCQGYFVENANNKNLTGVIKKRDIKSFIIPGDIPICECEYTGDLGINKKKYFYMEEVKKNKTLKNLKKVRKHADSKKCNKSKEMCLIKK